MVFLIVFPSFLLKNDAFLIGFQSFLLLFSYCFYLFSSFLMHDGCGFFRTLSGFMIIPFLMPFINQLPIVYCFSVYHSPCIFMFFLNHSRFFLLLSVSLHSSEQIVPLWWTVLSTLVHKPVHLSATIQMPVGKYANVCSIFFQQALIIYCKAVCSLVFNLIFSLESSLRIYRINSQNTMRNALISYEKQVVLCTKCVSYYEKCRFVFYFS